MRCPRQLAIVLGLAALAGSPSGQEVPLAPPIERAAVLLDGTISTLEEPEMCAGLSRDGKTFYFNRLHQGHWTIVVTSLLDGEWTEPEPMPFSSGWTDRDFTLSPDGRRILFGSNRPRRPGAEAQQGLDIYVTERRDDGVWGQPVNLGPPVNTEHGENYPSVADNGNLYFFSCREDGLGGCDIYLSRFANGAYLPPENLGSAINSEQHDWDSFIAPDESYIIFSSKDRPDTLGTQDLYISFRDQGGGWRKAVNMGPAVNSTGDEICPSVSLDGRVLFFTSRRRGKADIFWIDASVIERFRPDGS